MRDTQPVLQRLLGYTGSVDFRPALDVLADREAGRAHPWVHPQAAAPGVTRPGGPLPPDANGNREVDGEPYVWPAAPKL